VAVCCSSASLRSLVRWLRSFEQPRALGGNSPPFELALDLRRDAALLAAKFTLFSIDFFLQKAPATSV
jgi:hypothetical protein